MQREYKSDLYALLLLFVFIFHALYERWGEVVLWMDLCSN